ncbi:MAG: lysophospholipase [Chloroflexota bacterium]|nr:lysophospholipase [Chloroflexota bacterium]
MREEPRDVLRPEPRRWRLAPDAWRLSGRVTPARLDRYLRYRTARGLPRSMKARFRAMRIPEQTINEVLGSIRGLSRWMDEWNLAAQRFLTEARTEERSGRWQEAAVARICAAMCFHIAHLVTDTDPRTLRTLRASCVTTFAQAVPRIMPNVRKVSLPWRNRTLPAYLAVPPTSGRPAPLFVFLNGATTCKEELLLWCEPLLEMGIAVMTIDWPGTGETASFTRPLADCDDMTDGVFTAVEAVEEIDPEMVAIGGISLGGAVAIRCAAYDRRLLGAMAVTPPYDPLSWWGYVNPLVRLQLMSLGSRNENPEDVVADFALTQLIPRMRSPLLVCGAGRDMVVPPDESLALASAAGDLATLVWYPEGGHGLYTEIPDWMDLAGKWLHGLAGNDDLEANSQGGPDYVYSEIRPEAAVTRAAPEGGDSTRVDPVASPADQDGMSSSVTAVDDLDLWEDD